MRELPKKLTGNDWLDFTQSDLVGDSLFVRYWKENDDEMHSHARTAWLGATGPVVADREIESVVEAGDATFAVNPAGTRLLRLNKQHHIQDRLPIERPEIQQRKEAQDELTTYGLSASPDGKRVIVFVGLYQGC